MEIMNSAQIATIDLDGINGRGTLVAVRESYPDGDDVCERLQIMCQLPDGSEEQSEVSTRWGEISRESAERVIAQAWGASCWGLEWIEA